MNLQVTDSTANAERALLFESVGKNLNKAQEAFDTASKHLKTYR